MLKKFHKIKPLFLKINTKNNIFPFIETEIKDRRKEINHLIEIYKKFDKKPGKEDNVFILNPRKKTLTFPEECTLSTDHKAKKSFDYYFHNNQKNKAKIEKREPLGDKIHFGNFDYLLYKADPTLNPLQNKNNFHYETQKLKIINSPNFIIGKDPKQLKDKELSLTLARKKFHLEKTNCDSKINTYTTTFFSNNKDNNNKSDKGYIDNQEKTISDFNIDYYIKGNICRKKQKELAKNLLIKSPKSCLNNNIIPGNKSYIKPYKYKNTIVFPKTFGKDKEKDCISTISNSKHKRKRKLRIEVPKLENKNFKTFYKVMNKIDKSFFSEEKEDNDDDITLEDMDINNNILLSSLIGKLYVLKDSTKTEKKKLYTYMINKTNKRKMKIIKKLMNKNINNISVVRLLTEKNEKKKKINFDNLLCKVQNQINALSVVDRIKYMADNSPVQQIKNFYTEYKNKINKLVFRSKTFKLKNGKNYKELPFNKAGKKINENNEIINKLTYKIIIDKDKLRETLLKSEEILNKLLS